MSRKQELALEIEQAKQQLRERERRVNYERVPFGDGYCSDPC